MNKEIRRWNRMIFLMGLIKIPMLLFVKPKIVFLNDESVHVSIKLKRRTKNHLNSMYLGTLVVGADVAAGIFAFYFSKKLKTEISFAFKSMNAEFIKRAESDIIFICNEGELIEKMVEQSKSTHERINATINVLAKDVSNEIVAKFQMNISVKVK